MEVFAVPKDQRGRTSGRGLCWASIASRFHDTQEPLDLGESTLKVTTGPRHVLDVIEWRWRMHRRLQSVLARRL